jgi:hypothetical protein
MKPTMVPLSKLVHDFTIYPRHRVDDAHVSDMVRALESGQELPPIIADAKTVRIVDGVHRWHAFEKKLGPDAKVPVELRTYKTEAALFLDAVTLNSAHGRKLDRHDQTRIILRMRELKVNDMNIALALHVPEPTIQKLSLRIVHTPSGPRPSKRGLEHLRGESVTEEQMSVIESVRSAEVGRLCLELTRLLEADLADLNDPGVIDRLRKLEGAIGAALKSIAA